MEQQPITRDMSQVAEALNCLACFISHEQIKSSQEVNNLAQSLRATQDVGDGPNLPTDAIVLCVPSVLAVAEVVLSALSKVSAELVPSDAEKISLQGRNVVLVLCGGIGHATPSIYDAVREHPTYHVLADEIEGKPEARVLQMIAERWFGLTAVEPGAVNSPSTSSNPARGEGTLLVVVEDRSTNCGGNAAESRRVLEACGVRRPRSVVVVQDPTMCRRAVVTFRRVYADLEGDDGGGALEVRSWPTFVPEVAPVSGGWCGSAAGGGDGGDPLRLLEFKRDGPTGERRDGLWDMRRFVDLVMGEIPRLRDDEAGYGPKGKGFIAHVDIPPRVEDAWKTIRDVLGGGGRAQSGSVVT